MNATATATTAQERQVRISTLAHEADSEAVQGLLETAAKVIAEHGEGYATMPPSSYALAEQISETFEPEVPDFEVGEPVKVDGVRGKITDRYLDEDGEWAYQVRLGRPFNRTYPYRQVELHAVEG